jgi:hypothetical protein
MFVVHVSVLFNFFCNILALNNIPYWVTSEFIFSIDQSVNSLLLKTEMLSDWSIYLTVFHMIGWSRINERLPDMTSNRMLLDVSVFPHIKN